MNQCFKHFTETFCNPMLCDVCPDYTLRKVFKIGANDCITAGDLSRCGRPVIWVNGANCMLPEGERKAQN